MGATPARGDSLNDPARSDGLAVQDGQIAKFEQVWTP